MGVATNLFISYLKIAVIVGCVLCVLYLINPSAENQLHFIDYVNRTNTFLIGNWTWDSMLLRFATYITADLESRRTNIGAEENDILFTRAWLLQYMKWQEALKTGWKILISQFGFIGLYFIYYLSINFFELVVFVTLQIYTAIQFFAAIIFYGRVSTPALGAETLGIYLSHLLYNLFIMVSPMLLSRIMVKCLAHKHRRSPTRAATIPRLSANIDDDVKSDDEGAVSDDDIIPRRKISKTLKDFM
jgi:hypothetical protein